MAEISVILRYEGVPTPFGDHPPYLPNPQLREAVNLAIYLKRPLLIKGEPGSGKTRLAQAVADELGLNYEEWRVKSTSRARDGLYVYDGIARLRDAHLVATGKFEGPELERSKNPDSYVKYGPLGRAFTSTKRTVVLIDEIDKADIDFPNDLLLELDEKRFRIEETDREVPCQFGFEPIIIATSNDEKDLPDAFLRRCIFHYIDFPDQILLLAIVNAHFPETNAALVEKAVTRFEQLRVEMKEKSGEQGKKVSTSELIDWFTALKQHPDDEALRRLDGKLPYAGVLLKSWDDHVRFLAQNP